MEAKLNKYVIMCVGHTHAGKTTFAKKLVKHHPSVVLIDSDHIASFLKEAYPLVVDSAYNKSQPNINQPNLKMFLFKDVYTFCLKGGFTVILSNGNISKDMRALVAREAKKQGYKLVTVYFNVPEKVIMQRLASTKKSQNVFIHSKSWAEVFERQKKRAQLPPSKRNTIYFEIKNNTDANIVMSELSKLL